MRALKELEKDENIYNMPTSYLAYNQAKSEIAKRQQWTRKNARTTPESVPEEPLVASGKNSRVTKVDMKDAIRRRLAARKP